MRRVTWWWVCLLFVAQAQVQAETDTLVGIRSGSFELGGAGGLSIPVADYGDLAELAGTVAFVVGYYPSPQFSFGLDAGAHWHGATLPLAQPAVVPGLSAGPRSLHVYRFFTPYAKYQFRVARVSPYATGLVGLYVQEVKWTETAGESVDRSVGEGYLGLAGGLGVQMVTDDAVVLSVEGRFHNAMRAGSPPVQFIDLRVGLAFLI